MAFRNWAANGQGLASPNLQARDDGEHQLDARIHAVTSDSQ
jgi:hypothetical protein